jgi:GrpB-like predicted nucleotidyltransferase (UPF0157 family)
MSHVHKAIQIMFYDPNWPRLFDREAALIAAALKSNCILIHHVGSTAVPDLAAKPVIDIIAVVREGKNAKTALCKAGYIFEGEWNIPFKFGFKRREPYKVNLHVYEERHPEIELNLTFRDYLREHSSVRDQYAALKEALLLDTMSSEIQEDGYFRGYTLGKYTFIQKVLNDAGFVTSRFLRCTHPLEKAETKRLLKEAAGGQPTKGVGAAAQDQQWVLYRGTVIIGCLVAGIQGKKAVLKALVIDPLVKTRESDELFLLEGFKRWVTLEGILDRQVDENSPLLSNTAKVEWIKA